MITEINQGGTKMVYSKEEQRERHRIQVRRSRQKLKKEAETDPEKKKVWEKQKHDRKFSAAKSFIRLHATQGEIAEIRDVIAERVKELRESQK